MFEGSVAKLKISTEILKTRKKIHIFFLTEKVCPQVFYVKRWMDLGRILT